MNQNRNTAGEWGGDISLAQLNIFLPMTGGWDKMNVFAINKHEKASSSNRKIFSYPEHSLTQHKLYYVTKYMQRKKPCFGREQLTEKNLQLKKNMRMILF